MLKTISLSILFMTLNAFAVINLPVGGSAVINGQTVTCSGGPTHGTGAISCGCHGTWGLIGEVLVSANLSPTTECGKISASAVPRDCKPLSSASGFFKCDCNGTWGSIGQIIVGTDKSAVDECRKLSVNSNPTNCSAL